MSSKVLVLIAVVCLFCSCWGDGSTTQSVQEIPMEPLEPQSDLDQDTSTWRSWRPFRFWRWGNGMLNRILTQSEDGDFPDRYPEYVPRDSQRTVTRRESSLISTYRRFDDRNEESLPSTARMENDPTVSGFRPKGAIRKELVTWMFDSMLHDIVESWQVLESAKPEVPPIGADLFGKSPSELTVTSRRRKSIAKVYKPKKSKSNIIMDTPVPEQDPLLRSWFSAPAERAVIRFKNGNMYEGDILMKCMHGNGRFQWADGTVYMGQFKENEIKGDGRITWKDDTWYEGTFAGNLRHGHGLYVDSRRQRSYTGGWDRGTKHGEGTIYYSSFNNSYDGEWINNVRHGYGIREYCAKSGYKGQWDLYIREGKGLMIWPNHDLYRGEWKNGVMSGYGMYIWDVHYNNSMSLAALTAYRGFWERGQRHGYGLLDLGMELGAHYKGEFRKNKKHGIGKIVTNGGLILQSKNLFMEDNFAPLEPEDNNVQDQRKVPSRPVELLSFDFCDMSAGLLYHVEQAIANIDKQDEIRAKIIKDYFERNKCMSDKSTKSELMNNNNESLLDLDDLIKFEEESLKKSVKCYEIDLKNIYRQYSTICNTEEVEFSVVMTRLYLWQFYYDCNINEKGLSLVEIDLMLQENPKWLARKTHYPFEKIHFWQFIHSLISVARKLYAKRELPGPKPDTIMASAFRTFMEIDVLPGAGRRKGHLVDGSGLFVPLHAMYDLYCKLGEPHTVRTFLRAVRYQSHITELCQPPLVETPDEDLRVGRNAVVYGEEFSYITEKSIFGPFCDEYYENENINEYDRKYILKLFNFANISSKGVIRIFAQIFPNLMVNGKIMDLDIKMTFFEFFEAFVSCAKESIRLKDEEIKWMIQFSDSNETPALPPTPVSQVRKPLT